MTRKLVLLVAGVLCALLSAQAQPVIHISHASANNGQTVNINLTVDNYTDYISLEFALIWDHDVVRYQSVSNLNAGLPGFTPASSINVNQGDPTQSDTLNVVWFESNLEPVSLPDGATLFTISYQVVGDPCDSTGLTIPNVEIVDVNEVEANVTIDPGYVTVPGAGCVSGFDGVRIIGETRTVSSGSNVCIPFRCEGFDDLIAASYTILFDETVIEYTGIQNINWPELAEGTTFSSPEADEGILRVVWFDSKTTGVTIADGTILYELCFNAIGSGGQSSLISFGDEPVEIEFANETDIVDFEGVPGRINIEGEIEGFALILPHIVHPGQPGAEVCLPITVNDFNDIIAVQASINWDSTLLEFDRFQMFNLNGLQESVSGPEAPVNNASQATIAWIDPAISGVTLANGAVMMEICFNFLGGCNQSAEVVWSDVPNVVEIADITEIPFPVTLVNGSVTLDCGVDCGAVAEVHDLCPGEEVGSIDVTLIGECQSPVTYLWWSNTSANGATTQDLNGVNTGKYVVTITVGGSMFIVLDTMTITVLSPIQVSANITQPSGGNNGAISLTVSGGEPGYSFLWNTNPPQQTQNVSGLGAGSYSVTITDDNGCTFVAGPFLLGSSGVAGSVTDVDCFGASTGAISITEVTCVTAPFTYAWSGPTSPPPVANISNLVAGTYTVTVTGNGGATCTASFTVSQAASAIAVDIDTTNATGGQNNGSIDLTVTGGQGPYTYQWQTCNGQQTLPPTQDQANLGSGCYNVTITDQFGCDVVRSISILGNALFLSITGSSFNGVGVSCANECDGEVFVQALNGPLPLTYQWNSGETTALISDVCAGTYSVTVTDGIGRTSVASYILTEPDQLILQLETNCASEPGVSDGSASAEVSGGTAPYHYVWSNGATATTISNVASGPLLVVVTDNNGCQVNQPFDVGICGIECYQAVTVITPNDDGKNDRFTINCIHDTPNRLSIFNRYGGLEFETQNYDNSWQGTDQDGNHLSDGGYHWVLEVTLPGGTRDIYTGTVSLVRSLD